MSFARRLFSTRQLPQAISERGFARLKRSLLSVKGPDASKFLNGLITNKVIDDPKLGFYAGFLNPKGRVLADTFLFPNGLESSDAESYVIDCDSEIADTLMKQLKLYKLRSKVELGTLDASVWSVWDDSDLPESLGSLEDIFATDKFAGALDTRSGTFGLRLALPNSQTPLDVLAPGVKQGLQHDTPEAYQIRRTMLGVPEGVHEFTPNKALPLEYCMDYMGGVDFDKGCYVGQELTIRSHHHGIVRKRVIPVVLTTESLYEQQDLEYDPSSPILQQFNVDSLIGSSIVDTTASTKSLGPSPFASSGSSTRSSGTLISAMGNVGLAVVRLEDFGAPNGKFAIKVPDASGNGHVYVYVKGFQPYWWPEQ